MWLHLKQFKAIKEADFRYATLFQHNYKKYGRQPQYFFQMEDNFIFFQMEDDLIFFQMEDDFKFFQMKDNVNLFKG